MSAPAFVKRIWLNPESSASTGSAVVYKGPASWKDKHGVYRETMFVEVADCHTKVRIHKTEADSNHDFNLKVKRLRDLLSEFLEFAESHNQGATK